MDDLNISELREVLENLPLGVLVLKDGKAIEWANRTMCEYMELDLDGLCNLTADTADITDTHKQLFERPQVIYLSMHDGEPVRHLVCLYVAVSPQWQINYYLDMNEEAPFQDTIDQVLINDTLTGLLSRQSIMRHLEPMVSRSRRYERPLSVMLVDVIGRNGGEKIKVADETVRSAAQIIRENTRWADMIGRFDHSTFLIILQETQLSDAQLLADKLRNFLKTVDLGESKSDGPLEIHMGMASWQKNDDAVSLLERCKKDLQTVSN